MVSVAKDAVVSPVVRSWTVDRADRLVSFCSGKTSLLEGASISMMVLKSTSCYLSEI